MRPIIIAIVIVLVGFGLFAALKTKAPADVQSATVGGQSATSTATTTAVSNRAATLTKFEFTGYGPGKEHVGTFKEYAVSDVRVDAQGVPQSGKFVIKTASIDTGIDGLNKHLNSEDFFNTAANPEIVFDLKSVTEGSAEGTYTVAGTLTFNGVSKDFSFPATATQDGRFAADFKFDTTFFNFKYTAIDKEVRVQFEGQVK